MDIKMNRNTNEPIEDYIKYVEENAKRINELVRKEK